MRPAAARRIRRPGGDRVDARRGGAPAVVRGPYSIAKAADDRLAAATATALAPDAVASVSLHPGLVRTEGVMQFAEHLDLTDSQSPEGVGRVVAALAADPKVMGLTGRAVSVATLAERYSVDTAT